MRGVNYHPSNYLTLASPVSNEETRAVGPAYSSYQEAEDAVAAYLVNKWKDELDPALGTCAGCGTYNESDRLAIISNLDNVCVRVDLAGDTASRQSCGHTTYRPSLSDPTLLTGGKVHVFNPAGDPYGTGALFRITYSNYFYADYFVINRPLCLDGWKPAYGLDANGDRTLACYLPAEATASVGFSGLDRNMEGACVSCNPVNLSTGDKMDHAVDYSNKSPFPIVWERYYLSSAGEWRFSYERRLRKWTAGKIEMSRPDGSTIFFSHSGGNADPWYPSGNAASGVMGRLENALSGGVVVGYDYTNLRDETEHYDADGRLIAISDRRGMMLEFDFDAAGRLVRVDDGFGRYLDIIRSVNDGLITSITDGERTISYTHTIPSTSTFGRPLLDQVTYPDNTTVQYFYDENGGTPGRGLLTGIVDQNNTRKATYTYDSQERVSGSVWDPDSWPVNQIGYEYDTTDVAGKPTKISWGTDSSYMNGHPGTGVYKGGGFDEPCQVCKGGEAASITYDWNGNPTQIIAHDGMQEKRTYNGRSLPTRIDEAYGSAQERTTKYTWHPVLRLPTTIVEDAHNVLRTTTNTYTNGQLTQAVVSTNGGDTPRTYTYTYNAQLLLATATGPDNRTITYDYDTSGNLVSVRNALNHETTLGNYTADGLARLITDPNGLQTKLTYDSMRRLTKVERGSDTSHWETTAIAYDIYGNLDRIDLPNGDWLDYTYDHVQQLIKIQSPTGIQNINYDAYGRFTGTSFQDNSYGWMWWRWITLDRNGNAIETGGSQSHDSYEYDAEGRLLAHNDLYQTTRTEHSYDALGRLNVLLDEANGSYQMHYDPQDQLVSAIDSRGNTTQYTYNGFGDLVGLTSPDTGDQAFTVNDNGEMLTRVDARGATTTITRDDLGRPTQIVFNDAAVPPSTPGFKYGTETQTFSYDNCVHGVGRLCTMTDEAGITTYAYDLWGRLTGKSFTPAGTTFTLNVGYGYTNAGELSSIQYPSGKVLDITNYEGAQTALEYDGYDILHGATYRPFHGKSLGWEWGGGLGALNYAYNPENQQKGIEGDVSKYAYFGGVGRLNYLGDNTDPARDSYMMQDGKDQLTYAYLFNRIDPIEFSYDANGNRTHMQVDASNGYDYTISSGSNRLDSTTLNSGVPSNWIYDASGNLIQEGFSLYRYGPKGRMSESVVAGSTTTYAYNAHNQRQRKTRILGVNPGTDYFIYDEEGRLLGVYDATGAMREEFVWFDGWRPVASIRPAVGTNYEIYRITSDHLGAPLTVRDDNGVKVWEWDAREPSGFQLPNQDPDGDSVYFELDLRFPGQWLDHETGLYHNGAREYSPKIGRYIQSDPLGLEAGWNTYAYVENNPTNHIDPTGLKLAPSFNNDPDAQAALNYLSNSPMARGIIDRVKKDSRELSLRTSDGTIARYFPEDNRIVWNPHLAIYCDTAGNGISPAMILLHEMYHFLQAADPFVYAYLENTVSKTMGRHPITGKPSNMTEEKAVQAENIAARQLGELERDSHYPINDGHHQKRRYINVLSPTQKAPGR